MNKIYTEFSRKQEVKKLADIKVNQLKKKNDWHSPVHNVPIKTIERRIHNLLKETNNNCHIGENISDLYFKKYNEPLMGSNIKYKNVGDLIKQITSLDVCGTKIISISTPSSSSSSNQNKIKSTDQPKKPQNQEVSKDIQKIFSCILESYNGALAIDNVLAEYEHRANCKLDFKKLGFNSILEFMRNLNPEEFSVISDGDACPVLCKKSEFKSELFGKKPLPSHKSGDIDSMYRLDDTVIKRLTYLLVEKYPHGLDIREIVGAYRGFFGSTLQDLEPTKYGHKTLKSLLSKEKDTVKIVPMKDKEMVLSSGYSISNNSSSKSQKNKNKNVKDKDVVERGSFPELDIGELFSPGTYSEVIVGEVYNPNKFWIMNRSKEHSHALDEMMDRMFEFYSCPLSERYLLPPEHATIKSPVAAFYDKDNNFYRAIILSIEDLNTVKLFYVDYGTFCAAPVSCLRYLHYIFFKLPAQAVKASLYGIAPPNGKTTWPKNVSQAFLDEVENQIFTVYINDVSNNKLSLTMKSSENSENDVGQILISKSLAVDSKDVPLLDHSMTKKSTNSEPNLEKLMDLDLTNVSKISENENKLPDKTSFKSESSLKSVDSDEFKCKSSANREKFNGFADKFGSPKRLPHSLHEKISTEAPRLNNISALNCNWEIDCSDGGDLKTLLSDNEIEEKQMPKISDESDGELSENFEEDIECREIFFSDEENESEKSRMDETANIPEDFSGIVITVPIPQNGFLNLVATSKDVYLPLPEIKEVVGKDVTIEEVNQALGATAADGKDVIYMNLTHHINIFMQLTWNRVNYVRDGNTTVQEIPLIALNAVFKIASCFITLEYKDMAKEVLRCLSSFSYLNGRTENQVLKGSSSIETSISSDDSNHQSSLNSENSSSNNENSSLNSENSSSNSENSSSNRENSSSNRENSSSNRENSSSNNENSSSNNENSSSNNENSSSNNENSSLNSENSSSNDNDVDCGSISAFERAISLNNETEFALFKSKSLPNLALFLKNEISVETQIENENYEIKDDNNMKEVLSGKDGSESDSDCIYFPSVICVQPTGDSAHISLTEYAERNILNFKENPFTSDKINFNDSPNTYITTVTETDLDSEKPSQVSASISLTEYAEHDVFDFEENPFRSDKINFNNSPNTYIKKPSQVSPPISLTKYAEHDVFDFKENPFRSDKINFNDSPNNPIKKPSQVSPPISLTEYAEHDISDYEENPFRSDKIIFNDPLNTSINTTADMDLDLEKPSQVSARISLTEHDVSDLEEYPFRSDKIFFNDPQNTSINTTADMDISNTTDLNEETEKPKEDFKVSTESKSITCAEIDRFGSGISSNSRSDTSLSEVSSTKSNVVNNLKSIVQNIEKLKLKSNFEIKKMLAVTTRVSNPIARNNPINYSTATNVTYSSGPSNGTLVPSLPCVPAVKLLDPGYTNYRLPMRPMQNMNYVGMRPVRNVMRYPNAYYNPYHCVNYNVAQQAIPSPSYPYVNYVQRFPQYATTAFNYVNDNAFNYVNHQGTFGSTPNLNNY